MTANQHQVISSFQLVFALSSIALSSALLYPASSALGLVASVSVPLSELLPERRFIVDWCFQMTYQLPFNLSSFYNIPIWPGIRNPKYPKKRNFEPQHWDAINSNWWPSNTIYNSTFMDVMGRHPSDLSAGELYHSIEDLLEGYGFHETCLMRSVCELARHPFDEQHRNILTDLITFLLSPSQHEGFLQSEQLCREAYEEAEQIGFLGKSCQNMYPDCPIDILSSISHILFQ